MPPSTKRSQRVRRETTNNNVDVLDSSPSRPAKRRKKAEEPPEQPPPEPVLPLDQAGIDMTDDDIVTAVIPFMQKPDAFVQASQDHADERYHEQNVKAFAKLAGKSWTYYITKVTNLIGRPPENGPPAAGTAPVDVDLGPSKHISRQHAEIAYDSDTEGWYIEVVGRNPIRIDDEKFLRASKTRLSNGQVIEIGGVEMLFVLPTENVKLQIHPRYLERAGLIQPRHEATQGQNMERGGSSTSTAPDSSSQPTVRGQSGVQGGLPIAPAPPDYRRPGTPVSAARSKSQYSTGKSPGFPGGTMLMNSDDVDLSMDSNSHIKPTYSYAQLISQAILDAEDEKLTLNGIYTFIMSKYSYYRNQHGGGWQNSIRHNLSLNKAFQKIARTTDEPGKGMKWHIVPAHRDEMARNCVRGGRGGHRGSPGSPSNLGLLTRASRAAAENGSEIKRSPRSGSPPPSSYPSNAPQYTPDRGGRLDNSLHDMPGDGSPLPRHRRQHGYGLSDNAPGSPPVLSSSYLQEEGSSFVTPAPHRVHPRLAPPSTAQRPSQHMPTSSPAPFWKFAEYGNTPLKGPAFDSSPVKGPSAAAGVPPSSSPAPARRSSVASPTRNGGPASEEPKQEEPAADEIEEEGQGFDLAKGFQTISSFHAPAAQGIPVSEPPVNGVNGTNGVNVRVN